jgi:glycosyltransferase involved in cell wall biosynthesis
MININKKTCIVVTCFDENQPGFLDFSYRIIALAKKYQLTIISKSVFTQPELEPNSVNYKVLISGKGKLGWMAYVAKCSKFIRQFKPDIVVLLHSAAAPITLLIGAIPTCVYWNEHPSNLVRLPANFSPFKKVLGKLFHHLVFLGAKKANIVMPIGEHHQEDLIQHKVDPNKIKLIYMGVANDFLLNDSLVEAAISANVRLIYVGTVSKLRGRDVMLEAMSIVVKKGIQAHLTIVGADTEQLDYCNQRIKVLDIKNNITLHGRVLGSEVPSYLLQADIGICIWKSTAWTEFNPPTKLFEYLVAGLPVLASNIRTHTCYVQNWHNGLIFDYDANSLAAAIMGLVNNKQQIQALKNQAKLSGQSYLWRTIEPDFLDAVQSVVNSSINANTPSQLTVAS